MTEFKQELAALLNRYSMEQHGGNTPDFVIADYLIQCLRALDTAMTMRDQLCTKVTGDLMNIRVCLPDTSAAEQPK